MSSILKSVSVSLNFENDDDSITEFCEQIDLNSPEFEGKELESIRNLQAKINQIITDKINTLKAANRLPVESEEVNDDDEEENEE